METGNPFVNELRRLYRNSQLGNVENRGLESEFSQSMYVATGLDRHLTPMLFGQDKRYVLVLLCGNPGDGKTAYLQHLAQFLDAKGASFVHQDEAGWQCHFEDHGFAALYDASESHDTASADDLLHAILQPLVGKQVNAIPYTALIAINDGRLADFFERYGQRVYPALWQKIQAAIFTGDMDGLVRIVDLKRRSIADLQRDSESLFQRILKPWLSPEKWEICNHCVAKEICPIRFNANTLSDLEHGILVQKQLEHLLLGVHLCRNRRPTLRDLRSMLSFLVTGDQSCEEIIAAVKEGRDLKTFHDRLYFQVAFNKLGSPDLIFDELEHFDPASAPSARLDRHLFFHRHAVYRHELNALFVRFKDRPDPFSPDQEQGSGAWLKFLKRRLYFEADLAEFKRLNLPLPHEFLPYRHQNEFIQAISRFVHSGNLVKRLARGISRSDGLPPLACAQGLSLKLSGDDALGFAVIKIFPFEAFRCIPETQRDPCVEAIPDMLIFKHVSDSPMLKIGLDLFELLCRMAEGYEPDAQEQRPLLLDLEAFKNQLLMHETQEVLLMESGERIHRVVIEGNKMLRKETTG